MLTLATGVSDEQSDIPVPALPGWSVKDAYAHLTGLCGDVLDGRMEDAGSPAWTARQVAARSGDALSEVCDEWHERGPGLDDWLEQRGDDGTIFVGFDVWNHHQDVRSAVGLLGERDPEHVDYLLERALDAFDQRFRDGSVPALRVLTGRIERSLGSGTPSATLRTTDYELLRTLFGRRSLDQMMSAEWDGDPARYLDHLHLFEPPVIELVD